MHYSRLELWGEVTGKNILKKKHKIPHIYINDEVTGKQLSNFSLI